MTPKPNQQSRRRFLRHSGAAVATLGGAGIVATNSANAQTDSQGLLGNGIRSEGGNVWSFISGRLSVIPNPVSRPDPVESLADDMRNEFGNNSEHWINYGNWLLEDIDYTPDERTVVGVDVTITRGRSIRDQSGTVQTTVEAEYDSNADEFTHLDWLEGAPEEPDYEVELENMAAENAGNELQTFRREFIDTSGDGNHKHPDEEYASKLAGRYSSDVYVGGDSVLELLLGEVDVDVF